MPLLELHAFAFDSLAPVSAALESGELALLTGASGSGKSRLLRVLADLDSYHGDCLLAGRSMADMPAPEWRRQVMLVPAESQWWAATVVEHFTHPPDAELLAAMGLSQQALDWPVNRLSSGEKQRLGLLRALLLEPRVLLLDEPTAHLDSKSRHLTEACLFAYLDNPDRAAIWISHEPEALYSRATQVWHLDNRRVRIGPPSDQDLDRLEQAAPEGRRWS